MSNYGNLQFLGDNSLTFEANQTHFSPKGNTTRFVVTSTNVNALISYYNYIIAYGATGVLWGTDGGEIRKLEVELPGLTASTSGVLTELFFDSWELLTNESTDSIFACPLIVGGTNPVLNYNDKVVLSRLARDGGTITSAVASCNADLTANLLTAPTATPGPYYGGVVSGTSVIFQVPGTLSPTDYYGGTAPGQLAKEIIKGQVEFESPTRILRHTSYCSAGATYNSSAAHEEQIYTTAQLLSEVGSGWTYNLPPRLYSKIAGLPVQSPAVQESPYYTWGWLKRFSREPVLANFMVEVSTEYELGLWSNLRYAIKS